MTLLSIAKLIGGPGSIAFLVVGSATGIAVVWLWPRYRRIGWAWLAMLFVTYVSLALPPVATILAAPFVDDLAGRRTVEPDIDTLIVFDGDNRRGRIDEAARIWSAAHPAVVIVSGQPWLLEHLLARGISKDRVLHEQDSQTTRDQVVYLGRYLADHPRSHPAVVASRLQIPRIAALVHRAGLHVSLYGARVDQELPKEGAGRYLPVYAALRISRDAFYERVALAYYRWRRWIDPPAVVSCRSDRFPTLAG